MGLNPKHPITAMKLESGLKEMAELQVGIILINEHNSDTKQIEVKERL